MTRKYVMEFQHAHDGNGAWALIFNGNDRQISSKRLTLEGDLQNMRLKEYSVDTLVLDGVVTVEGGIEIGCIRGAKFHGFGTLAYAQYKRDSATPAPASPASHENLPEGLRDYHLELKEDCEYGACRISIFDEEGDVFLTDVLFHSQPLEEIGYERLDVDIMVPNGMVTVSSGFTIGAVLGGSFFGYKTVVFEDFMKSDAADYVNRLATPAEKEADMLEEIYDEDFLHSVGGFKAARGNNKGRTPKWKAA